MSKAYLVIDNQVFSLKEDTTTIGRSLENDIVLHDPTISRRHLDVVEIAGDFWLVDKGSTSGTYLNGKQINKAQLRNGDVIMISQVMAKFVFDLPTVRQRAADRTDQLPSDQVP